VRKWYPILYDELQKSRETVGLTPMVVGTPGIGKSAFVHYLIGRLLQHRRDNNESYTVFYQYKEKEYYAFLSDGRVLSGYSVADIGIPPQDEDWCIVDGARVREYNTKENANPTIVVVTSPSKHVVHETTKHRLGDSDTFIMSIFDDNEMELMRKECYSEVINADDENYLEALSLFGDIPRLVLGQLDELSKNKESLESDLKEGTEMIYTLDRREKLQVWRVPHRIYHMNTDYDYQNGTIDWFS